MRVSGIAIATAIGAVIGAAAAAGTAVGAAAGAAAAVIAVVRLVGFVVICGDSAFPRFTVVRTEISKTETGWNGEKRIVWKMGGHTACEDERVYPYSYDYLYGGTKAWLIGVR